MDSKLKQAFESLFEAMKSLKGEDLDWTVN
jgi:hypothetical protein